MNQVLDSKPMAPYNGKFCHFFWHDFDNTLSIFRPKRILFLPSRDQSPWFRWRRLVSSRIQGDWDLLEIRVLGFDGGDWDLLEFEVFGFDG
jgi:hypothetical protein